MYPCQTTPLPRTYVLPNLANERIGNFMTLKRRLLSQFLGNNREEATGISYSIDHFNELLSRIKAIPNVSGMKAYFASYKADADPIKNKDIPAGCEDLLTVIYAPTTGKDEYLSDTGDFFTINFKNGKAPLVQTLTKEIAGNWVRYYRDAKIPVLEDAMKPGSPGFMETRSLFYTIEDIDEWIAEIECWNQQGKAITGVFISFAAYLETESVYPANQLTLIISLDQLVVVHTEKFKMLFRLEKTSNFNYRKKLKIAGGENSEDLDTGNPSPPANSYGDLLP